jgi:hypothetical protein
VAVSVEEVEAQQGGRRSRAELGVKLKSPSKMTGCVAAWTAGWTTDSAKAVWLAAPPVAGQ